MKKLTLIFVIFAVVLTACTSSASVADFATTVDTLAPDTDARITAPSIVEPEAVYESAAHDTTAVQIADEKENVETTEHPNITDARDVVFLTFDDGPCTYTERVLEILDEYGIKATFFLVGENVQKYPEYTRAIIEAGHDIGCHSVTHDYVEIYESSETISSDISAWESIISNVIGYVPEERLYRFPGGSTCSAIKDSVFDSLHAAVGDMGYRSFDWTFGNNDRWDKGRKEGQSKVDYLKESLITSLKLGGVPRILLVHETAIETVDTLAWTIEYLLNQGYTFGLLSDYEGEYLFR